MATTIMVCLAALMATFALLVTVLSWFSVVERIRNLDSRVKDYILVTPQRPGVQGSITVRFFEAMKEVCETAKAHRKADKEHDQAKENATALMSDVNDLFKKWMKTNSEFKAAVDRLEKIEKAHGNEQG